MKIALEIISVFGFLVTVTAFLWSIQTERNRRKRRILWEEIYGYIQKLAKKIRRDGFDPDIVVAVSGPPVLVAILLQIELDIELKPFYVCMQTPRVETDQIGVGIDTIVTHKWKTEIPKSIQELNSKKKVLIIEDFIVTGDTALGLLEAFDKLGYSKENVKVASMLATKMCETLLKEKKLHFVGNIVDDTEFYLPWGSSFRENRTKYLS